MPVPGALTRTLLLFQLLPSYKVTCVYCHRRCISSQVYINNNKIVIIKEEKVSLPRNPVTAPLRAARLPSARAWKEESIRRGRGTLHVCLHAPLVKPRATRARCKHTAKPKPKPCCRRFVARRQRGDRSPQPTELRGRPEAPGPAPGRRRRGVGSRAPPRGYLRPPPARRPGAMAEDAMESYLYAAYPPYSYRYPPPKGKGGAAGPGAGAGPRVAPGNGRVPQFLEQKYGYYHCKDCNIRWESAYVWCVQGTNKVYFRQFCRTCQKSYNPYRVEDITCQSCKQTRCTCPVKLRHVDPKRPHRQDLCGRCKGKRLSCDSTFSFKYII
uniref:Zygote arrest 1 n=1 Tax=Gallus gallus TaxID=9031 RepID=A0A8V0Z3Y7_CHICK